MIEDLILATEEVVIEMIKQIVQEEDPEISAESPNEETDMVIDKAKTIESEDLSAEEIEILTAEGKSPDQKKAQRTNPLRISMANL